MSAWNADTMAKALGVMSGLELGGRVLRVMAQKG